MSEEIKPHHLRALACDIEDCHNPQSWADYCRAAAAMLEIKADRIAELEAALREIKYLDRLQVREALKVFFEDWPVIKMPDGTWKMKRVVALEARIAELRKIIRYVAGCEHKSALDEDLLEQVAAAICRINGIDPTNHIITINGGAFDKAWKHYIPQARAALGEQE